jgi:hypothetical protein
MPTKTARRTLGILRWPPTFPERIKYGEGIVSAIEVASKTFVTPTPALSVLTGAIDTLSTCETAANTRAKGTAPARDAQWLVVESVFDQALAYVQVIADAAGSPAAAVAIFELAGMSTSAAHGHAPRVYKIFQKISGTVQVTAPVAADNTAIIWEYGPTQATMTSWVVTIKPLLTLTNQTPGTTVCVRYRVVTTKGYGDLSQVLSIQVT